MCHSYALCRQKMQAGEHHKDSRLMWDLMDESKILDEACPTRKVPIGPNHQAAIPLLANHTESADFTVLLPGEFGF